MGYMRHHAIIVSSWREKDIAAAHEKAKEIFGELVTEMLPPAINGYISFFVGTDGSKEFWPSSDEGDTRRKAFRNWVGTNSQLILKSAEVQFADEEDNLWVKQIPDYKESTND